MACSEVSKGIQRIFNANSLAISSIQYLLKEIGRALEEGVADILSGLGESDEKNLQKSPFQESLTKIRDEMAKRKRQLEDSMEYTNAIPETFNNSLVEKNASKQIPPQEIKSGMDQSEVAAQLAAFTAAIEDMHRETKDEVKRLLLAIDSQCNRVGELLRNSDEGGEPKAQSGLKAAEVTPHSLAQNVSQVAWAECCLVENREKVLTLFSSRMPMATTHTWTFDGYTSLNEKTKAKGHANVMLEPVYVRGYCVSLGVRLLARGNFCILFQLHKGEMDQFLEWPFKQKIKVAILQPQGTEKVEHCVTPQSTGFKCFFLRPTKNSNDSIPIVYKHLPQDVLEGQGFIKDGRMLLSITLEAP